MRGTRWWKGLRGNWNWNLQLSQMSRVFGGIVLTKRSFDSSGKAASAQDDNQKTFRNLGMRFRLHGGSNLGEYGTDGSGCCAGWR